jgi:DDE superfamily endonuclease
LTPFTNAFQSSPEDSFNFYLSQLRITIERAFGIMVTLFGILQSAIKNRVPFTVKIVQACMRVHNFRIAAGCQPPRRSACINYADPSLQCMDLLMADPRFQTDPVASTPRLIVQAVQQHFETTALRRESMCDLLREAGGERPVGNVAQQQRELERAMRYADPLNIDGL